MDFGCIFRIYDLFLWKVFRRSIVVFTALIELRIVNKSVSCLYHVDKMQIFSLYII